MKSELEKNSSSNKFFYLGIITLVLCASVIRLTYFFTYQPPLDPTTGDSPVYDIPAWNFAQGNGYVYELDTPFAIREPGYAVFFIAPIYSVFGHSYQALALMQFLVDIVMMVMVVFFVRHYKTDKIALIAGVTYLMYLPFIFQAGEIMTEVVYQFLVMVSLCILVLALETKKSYLVALSGVFIGLTMLVRWGAILLPIFLLPIIWVIYKYSWKQIILQSVIFLFAISFVVSPWIVRNYMIYDQFIFGRIGGGEIYWSGSYIPYDGEWVGSNTSEANAIRGDSVLLEADNKFMQATIQNIESNPLGVVWIWLKKPLKIYLFPEVGYYFNNTGVSISQTHWFIIAATIVATLIHWVLFIGAAYSIFKKQYSFNVRYVAIALIIFSVILYMPLNPVRRYNVPLMPIIIILAAPAFYDAYKKLSCRLNER